jgi:hypothetical protein
MIGTTLICACSDDDAPTTPPDVVIIGPETEDGVMHAFRTAYEARDLNVLQVLLHSDFVMPLQPWTQQEFPDLGTELNRADEMRIAERMFRGTPVTDPDGVLVPGISNISFSVLEPQGAWADTEPGSDFPGARFAIFDVIIQFDRAGYSTLKVLGQLKFYVSGRDTVVDGANRTYFTMIGQGDFTGGGLKSIEDANWGSVKALFR